MQNGLLYCWAKRFRLSDPISWQQVANSGVCYNAGYTVEHVNDF